MEFFNPSNAFDAEGLTRLTEQIEHRKKQRNDVEQDTLIAIRNKNLEAEKLAWTSTASSSTPAWRSSARSRSQRARSAPSWPPSAPSASRRPRRADHARRPSSGAHPQRAERGSSRSASPRSAPSRPPRSSAARRWSWPSSSAPSPWRARARRRARPRPRPTAARARGGGGRGEGVHRARGRDGRAQEGIELIGARQAAEREALRLTLAAAGREGGQRRPRRRDPRPGRGRCRCRQDPGLAARARRDRGRGPALMNEAHNMLTPEARMSALRLKLVEKAEAIIRESVRPMERIEGIKILHVDGLGGGGGGGGDGRRQRRRLRRRRGQLGAALPRAGAAGRPAAARDRLEGGDIQRLVGGASGGAGGAAAGRAQGGGVSAAMIRLYVSSVIDASRRHRVVAHPRLQRPAVVAPGHRRQPHREQRTAATAWAASATSTRATAA
jgi:hypothetical protein